MNPDDTFSVAVHEAGHSVSASHYKIPSYPEILHDGQSVATQTMYPDYAGLCSYDGGQIPPFQLAVISWSGLISQCLYADPPAWAPPFKPSGKLLRDWHGMVLTQIRRLSDGDRAGILGSRDNWRSCKSAFAIVCRNRARIIRLARAMTGGGGQSVPMPPQFPATFADFLKLVVAADGAADPDERLRAFISDRVEKYFVEMKFPLDSAQHELGLKNVTAARLAEFQQGFPDAASWRATARAFKAWATARRDHK
jgi:hypothetical protein